MKIATDSSLQEPSAGGSTQGPDRGKWAGMAETTMNGDVEGTKAGEDKVDECVWVLGEQKSVLG